MALIEGRHYSFSYQGKELKGLVIQIKDGNATIKLDTGYNIIVPEADVTNITTVEEKAATKPMHQPLKQDTFLPHVTILHTGGTIASKVDYSTGAVVAQFDPQELVAMFPELTKVAYIESKLIRNMQSDDMRFAHYNIMADAIIEESRKDVKGIIITHGTDTLHYTSAALAFALEGLNIPVVLVGSQRSSDRGSSDATTNLMGALQFITQGKTPGVFIAMHETSSDDSISILDGLHARKNHTSRRDAFVPVNALAIARVQNNKVEFVDNARAERLRTAAHPKPRKLGFKEDLKVGWWRVHTQSFTDELVIYDHYDGLLIEGTGLGHAPISEIDEFTAEHARINARIAQLAKKIPVAMATQTIFGRVNMNVYSPGRTLQEYGVIGQGCDMHPETAFIKLAWLLSNHTPDETRKLFSIDLRGEITTRSPLVDSHAKE